MTVKASIAPGEGGVEYLLFRLDDLGMAIRIEDVAEIVRAVAIRPVPDAPAFVEGLIDVRGEPLPVVDIRQRLTLPPKPIQLSDHMIIAMTSETKVVIRVSEVQHTEFFQEEDVAALPLQADERGHYEGVVLNSDGIVLIRNLTGFLSTTDHVDLLACLAENAAPEWPGQ